MATLKRPKAFEASKKLVTVSVEGSDFEIANLLKSRIIHQNIILFDFHDVWHEIEVLNFDLENSNLEAFRDHIEKFNLTLADIGVKEVKKELVYGLQHEDYLKIEALFPKYPYFMIGKLHKYFEDNHRKTFYADLRDFVKMCNARDESIDDLIQRMENDKNTIINSKTIKEMKDPKTERIEELKALGATEEAGTFTAYGISVSPEMIDALPDVAWKSIVDAIRQIAPAEPVPEQPEEVAPAAETNNDAESDLTDARIQEIQGAGYKYDQDNGWFGKVGFPVVKMEDLESADEDQWKVIMTRTSKVEKVDAPAAEKTAAPAAAQAATPRPLIKLETFATLTPDRISELAGLEEKQQAIVVANPFVKVTDAKSLKAGKTAASNLLKASTSTEKIETDASKFLNTFKTMLKNKILPAAKITRDALEKQKKENTAFEEAEALKAQEEQKQRLAKIKERTDRIFAIPMTFDGSMYSIGTFYIMPTQIETADDAEFEELISQALAAKKEIDDAADSNNKKDDALMAAAEQLAKFNGKSKEQNYAELNGQTWIEPATTTPATVQEAAAKIDEIIPAEEVATEAPATTASPSATATPAAKTDMTSAVPATMRFQPAREFVEANPDDAGLLKFDLEHVELLQAEGTKAAMVIRREYFKYGRLTLAQEIDKIFQTDSKTKAQDIKDLIAIIQK